MSNEPISLLICMNGAETTTPAVDYGLWLAERFDLPVILLGISEQPEDKPDVERQVSAAVGRMEELGIPFGVRTDEGPAREVIAQHANTGSFFTVVSPLGRPMLRRMVKGRSIRRLLKNVPTPIFYVREAHSKLNRLLVCLGGLDHSIGVVRLCLYLAQRCNAQITLLHVVEPISLQYPISKDIDEHRKNILETDTPQSRSIRKAMEEIKDAHLQVYLKIRHGTIIHEIIEEAQNGDYDLVAMGSPYSAHSLRQLYLPNVTAEVAEAVHIPVLTVREGHELVESG